MSKLEDSVAKIIKIYRDENSMTDHRIAKLILEHIEEEKQKENKVYKPGFYQFNIKE